MLVHRTACGRQGAECCVHCVEFVSQRFTRRPGSSMATIVASSTIMPPAVSDFHSGFQTDIEVGVTYLAWSDNALPLQA